jgi:hypothetical protein
VKSGSLVKVSLFLSAALLSASITAGTSLPAGSTPAVQPANSPHVQLADEITRRLRRIGFNYIHSYGLRPSDLAGEPC